MIVDAEILDISGVFTSDHWANITENWRIQKLALPDLGNLEI